MSVAEFDIRGFYEALDAKRTSQGLSWSQVVDQIWCSSCASSDGFECRYPGGSRG
jgi:hypothetical protein